MASALVGRSGQVYKPVRVIYRHTNKDPEFNIHLASGEDNIALVLRPVTRSVFEQSKELRKGFGKVRQVRHHIDEEKENRVFVYNYAISNVPEMINDYPPIPLQARKTILRGWTGIERYPCEKLDTPW